MAFLMRVFNRLAEDENEKLLTLLRKMYGPLPQLSMLFPFYRRSELPKSLLLAVLYTMLITWFVVTLGISTCLLLLEDEFEKASLVFHYMLLVFFVGYALVEMNRLRKVLVKEHVMISSDIGHYCSGRIYSDKRCIEFKEKLDQETLAYMAVPALVFVVAALIFCEPYALKLIRGDGTQFTSNGINLNLPVPAYYPYPTDTGILHFITVGSQIWVAAISGFVIVTLLFTLLKLSQRIRYEYKVLQYSMESLFSRADKLYELKHQRKRNSNVKTTNPHYQKIVGICLRDSVMHHHNLVKLTDIFTVTMRWPVAVAYSVGTGGIALSLLSVMLGLKSRNLEDVLLFSLLCLCEVLNMLVISLMGESLTSESIALRDQLYHASQWYKLDIRNRKMLLNFQVGVNKPFVIRAVLVDINMDTFSSIMNSAYSFFNLMNV